MLYLFHGFDINMVDISLAIYECEEFKVFKPQLYLNFFLQLTSLLTHVFETMCK